MTDWKLSTTPNAAHLEWVERGGYALASPNWASCLSALGARTVFAWSDRQRCGLVIPVFSRFGLIRMAFLGFPITGILLDQIDSGVREALYRHVLYHERLHVLRITSGAQLQLATDSDGARPDVWISNVAEFRPSRTLKNDLAFSERALRNWRIDDTIADGSAWHALYLQVIKRHRGRHVYTLDYFKALSGFARFSETIKGWSLVDDDERIRAFAIFVQHGDDGLYFHSAADDLARKKGASDALLARLLDYARHRRCRRLLLMASPWDQPGLVRFKRKWGDKSGFALTYHRHRGLIGLILKKWFQGALRRDRRFVLAQSARSCD